MTYREYLTRLAWLKEEWKEPSRSDYYQMQTAMEVRRVLSKKPNRIKLKHFLIQFNQELPENQLTEEEINQETDKKTQASKSFWMGVLSKLKGKPDGRTTDS